METTSGLALQPCTQSKDLRAKEEETPRQREPGGWHCRSLSGDLVWGLGLYIWWKVFGWAPCLVCGNKARILMETVAAIRVLVAGLCFAGKCLRLASGHLPRNVLDPAGAMMEELRVSAACPLLFLRHGGGRAREERHGRDQRDCLCTLGFQDPT